jgi:hypothetical protein
MQHTAGSSPAKPPQLPFERSTRGTRRGDDDGEPSASGSEDEIDLREGWASWRSSSDSGWSNQPLRLEAVEQERFAFAREMHSRSVTPAQSQSFALPAAPLPNLARRTSLAPLQTRHYKPLRLGSHSGAAHNAQRIA